MATTVTGDLRTVTTVPAGVTAVRIKASRIRPSGTGLTTDQMVPADWDPTTGQVSFTAEPGPAVMIITSMAAHDTSVPLVIPDKPTATLRECVEAAMLADAGTITELQRLALEVTEKVATITNITMLEEWADTAKQDATTATSAAASATTAADSAKQDATTAREEADRAAAETATIPQEVQTALTTSLAPTIQTELDTRVPPQVASAIAADRAVADAAAAAVDEALTGDIGGKSIALDTDGTPYWAATGATHFLLTDTLGPYFTDTLARTITADTDGTPVLA